MKVNMSARSYLYVPAESAGKLAKSLTRGADVLIVDLEDSVSAQHKVSARRNLESWLEEVPEQAKVIVRINSTLAKEDLFVGVHQNISGIMLPKTSSQFDVEIVSDMMMKLEMERNIAQPIEIYALIESAMGVHNALSIAQCLRVTKLILGELDLKVNLRLPLSTDDRAIQFARSSLVYASAAAGIDAPIASVSRNFRDLEEFRRDTITFANQGFFGRTCIHPDQIAVVNEVFTPTSADIEKAKDILQRLDSVGGGAVTDSEGAMIDEAVAKNARRILGSN